MCKCGESDCPDFYNQYQRVYHPLSYKINPCPQQGNCEAGFYCPLIHPEDMLHFEYGEFFRFDIRTFKTIKCLNKHPHQRKTCLYYHNDKDKRRPSNIEYNHFICTKQKCNNEICQFSHNKLQQLYHPNRYKTKFCQFYPNNIEKCDYKSFCSFAHTQSQIIENIELIHLLEKNTDFYIYKYKTIWCPFTQNHERDKCPYAHNIQDYRRNPKEYDYEPVRCEFWNFSDEIKSIEGAGCKMGMSCKKCHGWMQQRYHPSKYNPKRSKSLKKEDFQAAETIVNKKLTDLNVPNDFKVKGKGNTNPQILKSNYSKGTPFFKNDKYSEYSAKTKARSNNIESDKSIDGSSNKQVQKQNDQKILPPSFSNIFSYAAEQQEEIVNWQSEHGRVGDEEPHNNKEQSSSRSKSAQKSEQYEATYSNSMKSVFQDDEILKKLRKAKFNQIQIVNMDQTKIDKLSFLNTEQKNRLAMRLHIYNMKQINTVSYSKELTKYFISKKKEGILQKMQQKRVKQSKLLKLFPKQINQLSFLEPEEKTVLPKLLKQYSNEKEFKELNQRIEEETKMK